MARIIKNKDFICPAENVKKDSEGTIVEICEDKGTVDYLVEIDNESRISWRTRSKPSARQPL